MLVEARKIGRYDPTLNGTFSTRYEGYCNSASGNTEPALTEESIEDLKRKSSQIGAQMIVHSTKLRGVQTAQYLARTDTLFVPTNYANEVTFDMRQMVSETEYNMGDSNLVRARFIESFRDNTLLETRDSIKERLEGLLELLRDTNAPTIVLVSHSFFMKILQGIVSDIPLFAEPQRLEELINPNKKTFEFGEGFTFEMS